MTGNNLSTARALAEAQSELTRLRGAEQQLARTLEALRASEERLRLAVDAADLGIWEWDVVADRVTWDARKHQMFGLAPAAFAGTREAFFDLVHPADRDWLAADLERALTVATPYRNEFRVVTDRGVRWVANAGDVVRDDQGRAVRMLGVVRDITDSRLAQEAIRASEDRFRAFVETTRDWIWEVDLEGRVLFSNRAVESMLGMTAEELVGSNLLEAVHPDDRALAGDVLADAMSRRGGWSGMRLRCRHRDGSWRYLECHGVPVFGAAGEIVGFRGSDRDVTPTQRVERAAGQAERLESLARIVGALAHHFNNLFTTILGNAELAGGREPRLDDDGSLAQIIGTTERGAHLVDQLLAFAGRRLVRPAAVDLGARIAIVRRDCSRDLPSNIAFVSRVAPGTWTVDADGDDVALALWHLVTNAREAMPQGGTLTVGTRNVRIPGDDLTAFTDFVPGDYVEVTVTDTGTGMTEDILEHACEPFFTTKSIGAMPVGLGLSTCIGIAAQHGGGLRLDSTPGVGTTARLFLWRSGQDARGSTPPPLSRIVTSVLLVLEESRLRTNLARVLQANGCRAIEVSTTRSALQIARAYRLPIDVLIVAAEADDALPRQLRVEYRGLRVLRTIDRRHATGATAAAAGERVLPVPCRPVELLRAIRDV